MYFDLCLASNWEYDTDFIRILDSACIARGLTLLTVTPRTLADALTLLATPGAGFRVLLDRASEADPAYLPLVDFAKSLGARRLNPRELADRAYDKAAMHHVLREAGLQTPSTLILPSFREQPDLPALDITPLNGCFAVKPALGGGGEGVVTEVCTLDQVLIERQKFPEQQYLLQAHVTPKMLDGLPAWFRVIYCLGEIYFSFWDTTTHIYTRVSPEQEIRFGLGSLREVTERIARICCLELFSTEVALTEAGQFLVVDYVNDPIDLRLHSRAKDGVPDAIVENIAARIAEAAQTYIATD
jgi:hypothetical protein